MSTSVNDAGQPALKDSFAMWERVVWPLCFAGFIAVALVGIHSISPVGALVYAGFALLGLAVGFPSLCSHCPYPTRHSTCLFLPPKLVARLLPYRGPRLSRLETVAVLLVTTGLFLLPQVWLIRDPIWLLPFWALALPVAIAFPVYYCRRCRHAGCPMNRVPRNGASRG
jgi:hypothetical protein